MLQFNFLDLPAEIRQSVYCYHLPVRRLCLRKLLDPEFKIAPLEGREIPSLLFASKQVNEEAAQVFYSKAIFELATPRLPYGSFGFTFSRPISPSRQPTGPSTLFLDLDEEFSPSRKRLLKAITTVHIFSDQRDAISAESYEATLNWLVINTNVQEIRLSRRMMCRIRKTRVVLWPSDSLSCGIDKSQRAIRVYAFAAPTPWELTRRFEVQAVLKQRLRILQTFCFLQSGECLLLQADPWLDVRSTDEKGYIEKIQDVGAFLKSLARQVPIREEERIGDNYDNLESWGGMGRAGAIPSKWLYQLIFVPHKLKM